MSFSAKAHREFDAGWRGRSSVEPIRTGPILPVSPANAKPEVRGPEPLDFDATREGLRKRLSPQTAST